MAGKLKLASAALALALLSIAGGQATAASFPSETHPGANAGNANPGLAPSDPQVAELKSDIMKLASQVAALQAQVTALQGNVQAFHTQFNQHVHTTQPPQVSILTILKCSGFGQPCTSATPLTEITVLTPVTNPGLGVTSGPTAPPGQFGH
jgi:hypothetical protein